MTISQDGKGTIGLTVQLSGIFTLNGKQQTTTVSFNTELGRGTTWDGFSLELNEIDSLRVVTLENLQAHYSVTGPSFGGEANNRHNDHDCGDYPKRGPGTYLRKENDDRNKTAQD